MTPSIAHLIPAAYLLIGFTLMLIVNAILDEEDALSWVEIAKGTLIWPVFLLAALETFLLIVIEKYRG